MRLLLVFATLACAAAPALAQSSRPIEIGVDAGISYITTKIDEVGSTNATIGNFPVQSVRLGIPVARFVAVEGAAGVSYFDADGDNETSFSGELAALVHVSANGKAPQPFVRPFVGYDHDSFLGGSGNHLTFGGGLGVKLPFADRFAFRAEGRYKQYAKEDGVTRSSVGVLAGLSIFTK